MQIFMLIDIIIHFFNIILHYYDVVKTTPNCMLHPIYGKTFSNYKQLFGNSKKSTALMLWTLCTYLFLISALSIAYFWSEHNVTRHVWFKQQYESAPRLIRSFCNGDGFIQSTDCYRLLGQISFASITRSDMILQIRF